MLSLSAAKDGVILPSNEDRKRILTQMKVRTTLKEDKSWIQQRSNSEDEQNHSMARSLQGTKATLEGSPVPQTTWSPNHRANSADQSSSQAPPTSKSPPQKSPTTSAPSGYLIRGVFMKTVGKKSPSDATSNGSQKSAKGVSLPRFSQSYKMTTDEYKKLAPYNIKRELSDPGEVETSVSPDEQKKRTEAASSVLRQTAVRQRSYVLSAAKKSNGSPSQEALPLIAQRIVEEDDAGPRSRSQTVPASAWFNSRGKSIDTSSNSRRGSPASRPCEGPSSTPGHFGPPEISSVSDHKMERANGEPQHRSPSSQATEISERESDSTRTFPGFERKTIPEAAYEGPSDNEYQKVEAYLAKSGSWSSESSISTAGTQNEPLRTAGRDGPDWDTARSSSVSTESGVATPESQQGDPGSDSDSARAYYYPFRDGVQPGSPRSHRVPFYKEISDTDHKSKGLLFLKESVNSTELSSSPRYNSRSLVDLSELENLSYSNASYLNSSPVKRTPGDLCTSCGREIRNCAKITIDNLKICCHDYCFRCGICYKPMGDLLDKIFIHRDIVHCDKCYEKLF